MYEWDPKKSTQNKSKHGISFDEAREHIFEGHNLLAVGVARQGKEVRHAVIGLFQNKYYCGIFTFRGDRVRIISVRRARDEEEQQAKRKGL